MQTTCAKNSVPSKRTLTTEVFRTVVTKLNGKTISNAIVGVTKDNCLVNIGCKSFATILRVTLMKRLIIRGVIIRRRTVGKNGRFNNTFVTPRYMRVAGLLVPAPTFQWGSDYLFTLGSIR